MSTSMKNPIFGQKGARDRVQSLAESLLTGKPMSRAPKKDRTPKLKPRPKAIFGRKIRCEPDGTKAPLASYFVASLVACGFCLAVIAQIIVAS